jgi:hypothetical protein
MYARQLKTSQMYTGYPFFLEMDFRSSFTSLDEQHFLGQLHFSSLPNLPISQVQLLYSAKPTSHIHVSVILAFEIDAESAIKSDMCVRAFPSQLRSFGMSKLPKKSTGVRIISEPNYHFNRKRTSYGQTFVCTVHKMRLLICPYDVRFRLKE